MTEPVDPAALAASQGDAVLAAEEAAAASAAAPTQAEVAQLVAFALATWAAYGDGDPEEARRRIRVRLARIKPNSRQVLLDAFRSAIDLGAAHGMEQLSLPGRLRLPGLPAELRQEAQQADVAAREALTVAGRMLNAARTTGDVQAALAKANGAVTGIEGAARWGVNRGHSTGVATVAEAAGAGRLWVAERDACVHCLAYAGVEAMNGTPFPGGLTYGKKPLSYEPVVDPPLHRNCRCHIIVWPPEWGREFPLSLQREARRSVVRGFSLPSESERTRLDAAARLLASGAGLPRTVEEYGQKAVQRGKFPRGRAFPYRPSTARAPRRRK